MLPAPFCSTLLSLQLGKNLTKIFTMREKKMKLWRNNCLVFFFFLFVCISFLDFFFFLSYVFFCSFFDLYLRELSPMMSNKQTNKKIPIISASIAQSQRGFGDGMESYRPNSWMNTEGGRRRRRKKVNKVHEGVRVQKVQEDRGWLRSWRCVNTPHTTAWGRCMCRRVWFGC